MSSSVKTDVVIIGAGIMGASCAFRLSEQGLKVAVLEAQVSPAMGSTGRSAAGVRVQYTEEVNARISWESIQEYQHFQELYGEDAGYRPIGYLFLVPPERWSEHLDSVRMQERIGAPVRVLSVEDAQSLVTFETDGISGTTHGPADGIVDPHSVTYVYLRQAKERGASVYLETPMTGAAWTGNAWRVQTPRGIFEAEYLVNAAGSWAGEVARHAGLAVEVPVKPVRRLVFMTTPTPWQQVYPLTIDLTSGFYLRSEGQRILFGRSNPDEPQALRKGWTGTGLNQRSAWGLNASPGWRRRDWISRPAGGAFTKLRPITTRSSVGCPPLKTGSTSRAFQATGYNRHRP